jgi:hypothetical protein
MAMAGLAFSAVGASAQTFDFDVPAATFNGGVGVQPVGSYHASVDLGAGTITITSDGTPAVPGLPAPPGTLSAADISQVTVTFFTGLDCSGTALDTLALSGITTGGLPWTVPGLPDTEYNAQAQAVPPAANNLLANGTNTFTGTFALLGGPPGAVQSVAAALTSVSSRQWSGCENVAATVPEPASLTLLAGALLPAGLMFRRRRTV